MASQAEHPHFSIDDDDVQEDSTIIPAAAVTDAVPVAASGGPHVDEPHAYVPVDDKICEEFAEEARDAAQKPHALDVLKTQVSALKQSAGTTVHSWGERMYAYIEKKDGPPSAVSPTAPAEPPAADAASTDAGQTRGAKLLAVAADLGHKTRVNAEWALNTAAEGIKRLSLPSRTLRGICRHEASTRPVPQSVLLLCTAIISSGPAPPDLFASEEHSEATALLSQLESGKLLLLPPSIKADVAAAALKQLLLSLAEPLLLNRLADQWVAAAADSAAIKVLLAELPAANSTTLRVILEACRYLTTTAAPLLSGSAALSASSVVSASDLAAALAPALLWRVSVARRRSVGIIGTNLAALRSKLSGAVSSVTSGGALSSQTSPDATTTSTGRAAPGDMVSETDEEPSAAVNNPATAAAEVSSEHVHLDLASPGQAATADAPAPATAGAGGALPTSVFVKSMSNPLGFFARRSQAPAVAATAESGEVSEAPEEEEEPGQHVPLTGSDLAAVASVLQVLIVEGFDMLE